MPPSSPPPSALGSMTVGLHAGWFAIRRRTRATMASWLRLRSSRGFSVTCMCEWFGRSLIVGSTCSTPSTDAISLLRFSTISAMPASDVPSGPSTITMKLPWSSFGMNERPTTAFSGNVEQKHERRRTTTIHR